MTEAEEAEEATIPDHVGKEPKKVKVKTEHKEPSAPARITSEMKGMTERTGTPIGAKKKPKTIGVTPKTVLESTNAALVEMFNSTLTLLKATIDTGKVNPGQGLLGMVMVADLLHGGAYTCPNTERPYLNGNKSKYFGTTIFGPADFYPIPGFNFWDPFSSILQGIEALVESEVGKQVVAEVYLNANCPHVFPKLLSDEAYSKILLLALYMSHTDVFSKLATGIKTFVEGNAIQMKATGELVESMGKGAKDLLPLLSLVEGA